MRVALVTSLVSPLRAAEANGPHAVVVDLARGLSARGHRATVYAAEGSSAPGVEIVEVPVEPVAAAAAARVGRRPPARAVEALDRGFERLFELVAGGAPDVVSQHAFDVRPFELARELPTLHTLHLPPTDSAIVAAARASPAGIASVSRAASRAWEGATRREVILLRNGVPDPGQALGGGDPVALIAGRIAPEKGTDVAIRAARRAGLDVLVAGDAYDREYHARKVEPLLRAGEWIGPVPRAELASLMARSALLLMPVGWDEPFGLVAAEAQMVGCPVVGYRRGALPEVVRDGLGGWLVEPDDEDALVPAIHRVRRLDRSAIRARARRELGVERMVSAYEAVLASVAEEATGRRAAVHDRRWQVSA